MAARCTVRGMTNLKTTASPARARTPSTPRSTSAVPPSASNTTYERGPAPGRPRPRVVVHDRDGTWFPISGLCISGLTPDEFDRLDEGDESVSTRPTPLALTEILSPAFLGDTGLSFD